MRARITLYLHMNEIFLIMTGNSTVLMILVVVALAILVVGTGKIMAKE